MKNIQYIYIYMCALIAEKRLEGLENIYIPNNILVSFIILAIKSLN